MLWVWVIVLVVIIGGIAVVAAGRGDAMAEVYDDRPDALLPVDRPLSADDLRALRLNTGVRGYRMDEVDALLARLEAEMIDREEPGEPDESRHQEPAEPKDNGQQEPADSEDSRQEEPWGEVDVSAREDEDATGGEADDTGTQAHGDDTGGRADETGTDENETGTDENETGPEQAGAPHAEGHEGP